MFGPLSESARRGKYIKQGCGNFVFEKLVVGKPYRPQSSGAWDQLTRLLIMKSEAHFGGEVAHLPSQKRSIRLNKTNVIWNPGGALFASEFLSAGAVFASLPTGQGYCCSLP